MTIADKPLCRNIARNVAALRRARALTLVELEHRLTEAGQRVPVLGLRRLERQQRAIDPDEWYALAAVFGVPPERLLADVPTCDQCSDAPPAGYACLTCGTKGGTG